MQTATLHVLPVVNDPGRIFEIRRLAQQAGCRFIPFQCKPRPAAPAPFDPNDGGRAA